MPKKLTDFFKNHFLTLILGLIIIFAFWLRIYKLDDVLGFYYDQGRDALVIWDLLYQGKLFLIGPTTGIEGIFRGPWYYWLITPFYFLGKGNPVFPAVFLAATTVFAIFLLYKVTEKVGGKISGLIAVVLGSFSYYFIYDSRWLSNPTPMFLISMILVYSLYLVIDGKKWAWVLIGAIIGMAMQFGSAAEVFYLPAIIVFVLWQKFFSKSKNIIPSVKVFVLSFFVLLLAFLPQVVFDIKHNFILSKNIVSFLTTQNSFKLSISEVANIRIPFYFETFSSKIFPSNSMLSEIFLIFLIFFLFMERKNLFKNQKFIATLVLFATPLVGMLFFQGNSGNVYGYYFTGYFFIFVILISTIFGNSFKNPLGKIILLMFLTVFLKDNLKLIKSYTIANVSDSTTITFKNQKEAVDWVYKDAGKEDFNVDVYVPPVIPYAYDYLFKWKGENDYKKTPTNNRVELLYTLYEPDGPHPERLKSWMDRQEGIAKIEKSIKFGAITVEKRKRI